METSFCTLISAAICYVLYAKERKRERGNENEKTYEGTLIIWQDTWSLSLYILILTGNFI
jgi:hypothetical protein